MTKHLDELPRIGAHIRATGGLALVPQRAVDIGAEVVQIFNSNARTWRTQVRSPEEISAFLDGLRHHRLPLFFHCIYLINLATADEALRQRSIDALSEALILAHVTAAEGAVIHVGSRHDLNFAEATTHITDCVRTAYAMAEERLGSGHTPGPGAVLPDAPPRLLLETSAGSGTTVGGRLEELEALLQVLPPSCGICLDTAHMFAAGYPIHTEEGLEATVTELHSRDLLARVGLIHLNDSKAPLAANRDRHENLGDGLIGYEGLSRIVRHAAFRSVAFVLEVPGLEGHGPEAADLERAKSMRQEEAAPPRRPVRRASPPAEPT